MSNTKLKTHKATSARIRVTKTGKVLRRKAFSNHFLQKKSASRKRNYSGLKKVSDSQAKNTKKRLGV